MISSNQLLSAVIAFAGLVICATSNAQVGLQQATWNIVEPSASDSNRQSTTGVSALIWYPTLEHTSNQKLGPFRFQAALGATPATGKHPLVIVSHGTGGHELGHAWLATDLVRGGYVVVALRHAGDNFEDRSGVTRADYFERRPRQVSAVLSAMLNDTTWIDYVDSDRVAVVGHSAGGHVALALVGGVPSPARAVDHCKPDGLGRQKDAAMCALGGRRNQDVLQQMMASEGANERNVTDGRVRAAVAVAPLGIALDPLSLESVAVPVLVEYGERDEVLSPQLHAKALCQRIPRAVCVGSREAGHFAFFQTGTGPLPGAAGDASIDPPGFDRFAWQAQAAPRIREFLDQSLK
jgi:predicted dienelactone hydrolase